MPRALHQDDQAVSAVLGVILTVAMTVTLAAVVFLVGRGITDHPGNQTPTLAFAPQGQTVVVASVPPNVNMDWFEDVRISGSCAAHIKLTPVGTSTPGPYPVASGILVRAGDILGNCESGESIVISFIETEGVMYQHTF